MSVSGALLEVSSNNNAVFLLVARKVRHWRRIIYLGIDTADKYHLLGIYSTRFYMNITEKYNLLIKELDEIGMCMVTKNILMDEIVKSIIYFKRNLTYLIRQTGLYKLSSVISFFLSGSDIYDYAITDVYDRSSVLLRHFHPIRCKTFSCVSFKKLSKCNWMSYEKVSVDDIELCISNALILHVHGCKIYFYNNIMGCMLQVDGFFDNINIYLYQSQYISYKLNVFRGCKRVKTKYYNNILSTLSLRDVMIYDKNTICEYYLFLHSQLKVLKQQKISQNIILFDKRHLHEKYSMIYLFLADHGCMESSYMAYLLYDLLSSDTIISLDSNEQYQIFECFVYSLKVIFKEVMYLTIKYTRRILDADNELIPYEQQICLLRCSEYVKNKAMVKLKEIKNKSDDSSSKAKQYLDGLLKIPFEHYYLEDIIGICRNNVDLYLGLLDLYEEFNCNILGVDGGKECLGKFDELSNTGTEAIIFGKKAEMITNVDIMHNLENIKISFFDRLFNYVRCVIYDKMIVMDRQSIIELIGKLNFMIRAFNGTLPSTLLDCRCRKICHSSKSKENIIGSIILLLKKCIERDETTSLFNNILQYMNVNCYMNNINVHDICLRIRANNNSIANYIKNVSSILDEAVYGHQDAKNSMQRIIAQWINGEQTGHCLGFEGPPGCGKTSFAKNGIARCLNNLDGTHRPFAFIALGGSSNASFLEGHSYTYVGSTWGKIVDILIEKKCMNPIIFIDELDKISSTEHGKEINGILTHLIDTTQNHEFYDKYFMGVPLDLSKVLFIFSYNDPSLIDKIVLDRIHRIRFESLSLDDKVVIAKKHIIPRLLIDVGLTGYVNISDDVVMYIIKHYTRESGVRRLKELLYEIIGEINLIYMRQMDDKLSLPLDITIDDIRNYYFKKKTYYLELRPSQVSLVGVVNGLWANTLKEGGVLPIEVRMFPTDTFLEFKLTGLQGDVMKESMNVAKTVVWSLLLNADERVRLYEILKSDKMQGIHVHCSEGATPKDGPSAGMAITVALYSALYNYLGTRKVRSMVAMTGEINLRGEIGEIGGLDSKILGGLNVGIKEFIYPTSNEKDFEIFKRTFGHRYDENEVKFRSVSHINEILPSIILSEGDD